MPTYPYECTVCCHRFDEFQRMTEPPLTTCPKCAGRLRRLVSAGGGVIFKGAGFYATDYKNKGNEKEEPTEKEKPAEKKPAE